MPVRRHRHDVLEIGRPPVQIRAAMVKTTKGFAVSSGVRFRVHACF